METPDTRFSVWEMKWAKRFRKIKKKQVKAGNFKLSKSASHWADYSTLPVSCTNGALAKFTPIFLILPQTLVVSQNWLASNLKKDILFKCQKCWRMGDNGDLSWIFYSNIKTRTWTRTWIVLVLGGLSITPEMFAVPSLAVEEAVWEVAQYNMVG